MDPVRAVVWWKIRSGRSLNRTAKWVLREKKKKTSRRSLLHTIHSAKASNKSNTKLAAVLRTHRAFVVIFFHLYLTNCIDYKSLYFSPLATSHLVIIFILHFSYRIDMCASVAKVYMGSWEAMKCADFSNTENEHERKTERIIMHVSHSHVCIVSNIFIHVWCLIWAANLFNVSNISTK